MKAAKLEVEDPPAIVIKGKSTWHGYRETIMKQKLVMLKIASSHNLYRNAILAQ